MEKKILIEGCTNAKQNTKSTEEVNNRFIAWVKKNGGYFSGRIKS